MAGGDFAAAILLAAGAGVRFGAGRPKALALLGGRSLVRRAAEALAAVPEVGRLIVVAPPGPESEAVEAAVRGVHQDLILVPGGPRRRDSVWNGLGAAGGAAFVLVHDAARALATTDLAVRVLGAARISGAAIPAIPVADTLVRETAGEVLEEVPRTGLHAVQTPQGFALDVLLEAHRRAAPSWEAPDDGTMVRALGAPVALVPGDPDNIKITWPRDLSRAEAFLAARQRVEGKMAAHRVGFGWDVHVLVAGRPTVLAGVVLTGEFGPRGHSDGDPLAHAVCDALLGAAALEDIGALFPDADPRWKDAPGTLLLAETAAALGRAGWRPVQVDAVVVADEPKIAPHRDAIRGGLARALGLPVDAVSVKGKRTEGLGGLAGGKGMACHALAVVERVCEVGG